MDEYQDTNDLQELITALISDGKNRFLVGDIKQSIYRFRQADPGIFLTKYTGFRENGTGRRIDLNQNFRSDPAVLSAVNFIFRQLLRTEGGRTALELDYGDAEALHPGRSAGAPRTHISAAERTSSFSIWRTSPKRKRRPARIWTRPIWKRG